MPTPIARLSDAILVGHLQTPLAGATVARPDDFQAVALRLLRANNFDQAPVVERGEPVGFVLTAAPSRTGRAKVRDVVQPILPSAIAAEATPLEEALPWLHTGGFLYLLRGQSIIGFVVPSDLNKQAGRSYAYIALAELELRLADKVRAMASQSEVLGLLQPNEATAVAKRLRLHTEANVEADLVSEMNLSHLLRIVGSDMSFLASASLTVEEWKRFSSGVTQLRNKVAHATRALVETPRDVAELRQVSDAIPAVVDSLAQTAETTSDRDTDLSAIE